MLEEWLAARVLPHRRLHDAADCLVGLLVEIPGGRPGPWWTLDACVDTAPYGDEAAWSFSQACGDSVDGWLRGRGAADSKLAAAMFCHIAADLAPRAADFAPRAADLHGGLAVLLDVDEHTGGFGGARAYLADRTAARPAGVMIGYPGLDEVVVGGRGLWRAAITVHAPSGHSGSSRTVAGAISRAAHLVRRLDAAGMSGVDDGSGFPLPPKLSVTAFHGGQGFSTTPDRADINVDVRTTPAFDRHDAEALVRQAVVELDAELPAPTPTEVTPIATWPPFRLAENEQPAGALLGAGGRGGTHRPGEDRKTLEHRQPARRGRHRGHGRIRCAVRGAARHRRACPPRRTAHGVCDPPAGRDRPPRVMSRTGSASSQGLSAVAMVRRRTRGGPAAVLSPVGTGSAAGSPQHRDRSSGHRRSGQSPGPSERSSATRLHRAGRCHARPGHVDDGQAAFLESFRNVILRPVTCRTR